jgi:serine/threonine protein kinase
VVAGYEILGEIGRGGMGVVYKARQLALGRVVALKMILAGEHAGPEAVARFRTEARAVAALQHPGIVQIHEIGERDGRPYLALEYVEGSTLAEVLSAGPQPVRQAAGLVEGLARAVQYAHERGVIHRDLKPANILLQNAECRMQNGPAHSAFCILHSAIPKITDFGLAKQLGGELGQTVSGAVVGTPGYMAPEQAGGKNRQIGPAADVYSLGAILYECLTGRPPFRGDTPLDVMLRVLNEEPESPTRLRPDCPRDLQTICLKCLRKDPQKRYASAGELADDLARYLNGEPIRARPLGTWEWGLRWMKRQRAAGLLLAGALAALVVLTVLRLVHPPADAGESNQPTPPEVVREDPPAPQPAEGERLPDDLDLVPRTALGFVTIRGQDILQTVPADRLEQWFRPALGPEARAALAPDADKPDFLWSDVDRVTSVFLKPRSLKEYVEFEKLLASGRFELTITRTNKPYDREAVLRRLGDRRQEKRQNGRTFYVRDDTPPWAVYFAGERVLVQGHPNAVRTFLENVPEPNAPGPLRDALRLAAEGHHLALGFHPPPGTLAEWGEALAAENPAFRPHTELLAEAGSLALTVDLSAGTGSEPTYSARCRAFLFFGDEQTAQKAQESAKAAVTLSHDAARSTIADMKEEGVPFFLAVFGFPADLVKEMVRMLVPVERALPDAVVERDGHTIRVEVVLKDLHDVVGGGMVLGERTARTETRDQLRKIGDALEAYHKQHGRLPPAALTDPDGRPLLSWRVLLLPYLGEQELFEQFHLDEPWDSESNRRLLEKIPNVYKSEALLTRKPYVTTYQVVVGPDTLFEGGQGVRLDGPNPVPDAAILVAETREPVPWTKPADLAYQADKPLPPLGATFPDGFFLLLADGRPRFVSRTVKDDMLRALMTRKGSAEVDLLKLP